MGHDFGEVLTERDRRERGDEVVVTVREYRECDRCGETRVVSENKEVRRSTPAEPAADEAPGPDRDAAAGGSEFDDVTAEEDDGVILEDDAEAPPRAYGEWPEAEVGEGGTGPGDDHGPWPDEDAEAPDGDDEPTRSPADDAVPDDAGPVPADDAADADPDGSATVIDADAGPSAETADSASHPTPDEPEEPERPTPRPDPSDVELVCPDCGETWPSVNVSLRPGDICPDCRRGYLDEQVIQ